MGKQPEVRIVMTDTGVIVTPSAGLPATMVITALSIALRQAIEKFERDVAKGPLFAEKFN